MSLLSRLNIAQKLLGLVAASAAVTVVVGLHGLTSTAQVNDMLDSMYDNNLVPIVDVSEVNIQVLGHNRALYEHLFQKDQASRDQVTTQVLAFDKKQAELLLKYRQTELTALEVEEVSRVEQAWATYAQRAQQVLKLSDEGRRDDAAALLEGDTDVAFAAVDQAISKVVEINQKLAKQAYDESDVQVASLRLYAALVIGLGVLLTVVSGVWLARSITRPLGRAVQAAERIRDGDLSQEVVVDTQDETGRLLSAMREMQTSLASVVGQVRGNAESVATASAQIAQGNQDLSSRTEEQASSLQQTAASMEQLGSTVKLNADNARQANQLAQGASEVAVKGGNVVTQVVDTMKDINDSSRQIAAIISVIDGIAFQTNILALNAAVEAARAGEQGRGFAVVAGEVRNLAQRSAEAAKEIKTLITASVERVETGTSLVDQAGQRMQEIVGAIRRVTDIMGEISSASVEQSQGVNQIGEAVGQMDQVTQQNAALVEESAAAAESLNQQARTLVQVVSVFKLTGGSTVEASNHVRSAAPTRPAVNRPTATSMTAKPAVPKAAKTPVSADEWASF